MAKIGNKTGTGAITVSTTVEEDVEILDKLHEIADMKARVLGVSIEDELNLMYIMEQFVGKNNQITLQQLASLERYSDKFKQPELKVDVHSDEYDYQKPNWFSKPRLNIMRDCLARHTGRSQKTIDSIKQKARKAYQAMQFDGTTQTTSVGKSKQTQPSKNKFDKALDENLFDMSKKRDGDSDANSQQKE